MLFHGQKLIGKVFPPPCNTNGFPSYVAGLHSVIIFNAEFSDLHALSLLFKFNSKLVKLYRASIDRVKVNY